MGSCGNNYPTQSGRNKLSEMPWHFWSISLLKLVERKIYFSEQQSIDACNLIKFRGRRFRKITWEWPWARWQKTVSRTSDLVLERPRSNQPWTKRICETPRTQRGGWRHPLVHRKLGSRGEEELFHSEGIAPRPGQRTPAQRGSPQPTGSPVKAEKPAVVSQLPRHADPIPGGPLRPGLKGTTGGPDRQGPGLRWSGHRGGTSGRACAGLSRPCAYQWQPKWRSPERWLGPSAQSSLGRLVWAPANRHSLL